VKLSIFRRPGVATEHTLAHFEVTDIEATVRDLEARRVEFLDYSEGPLTTTGHIAQLGPARGAWFAIPMGTPSASDRASGPTRPRVAIRR